MPAPYKYCATTWGGDARTTLLPIYHDVCARGTLLYAMASDRYTVRVFTAPAATRLGPAHLIVCFGADTVPPADRPIAIFRCDGNTPLDPDEVVRRVVAQHPPHEPPVHPEDVRPALLALELFTRLALNRVRF